MKVTEDYKTKIAKKENLSNSKSVNCSQKPKTNSKKATGSIFNKIKVIFSDESRSKSLKEFPNQKATTRIDKAVRFTTLQTNSFKDLVYVNCLPKTLDEMSDFVSNASTKSGTDSC